MYSIGKFAKEIGLTTQTLRNWHKNGELVPVKVTEGGKRANKAKRMIQELTSDD